MKRKRNLNADENNRGGIGIGIPRTPFMWCGAMHTAIWVRRYRRSKYCNNCPVDSVHYFKPLHLRASHCPGCEVYWIEKEWGIGSSSGTMGISKIETEWFWLDAEEIRTWSNLAHYVNRKVEVSIEGVAIVKGATITEDTTPKIKVIGMDKNEKEKALLIKSIPESWGFKLSSTVVTGILKRHETNWLNNSAYETKRLRRLWGK